MQVAYYKDSYLILKEDSACKCSKCIYKYIFKERHMEYKYSIRDVSVVAEKYEKLNISIN